MFQRIIKCILLCAVALAFIVVINVGPVWLALLVLPLVSGIGKIVVSSAFFIIGFCVICYDIYIIGEVIDEAF